MKRLSECWKKNNN